MLQKDNFAKSKKSIVLLYKKATALARGCFWTDAINYLSSELQSFLATITKQDIQGFKEIQFELERILKDEKFKEGTLEIIEQQTFLKEKLGEARISRINSKIQTCVIELLKSYINAGEIRNAYTLLHTVKEFWLKQTKQQQLEYHTMMVSIEMMLQPSEVPKSPVVISQDQNTVNSPDKTFIQAVTGLYRLKNHQYEEACKLLVEVKVLQLDQTPLQQKLILPRDIALYALLSCFISLPRDAILTLLQAETSCIRNALDWYPVLRDIAWDYKYCRLESVYGALSSLPALSIDSYLRSQKKPILQEMLDNFLCLYCQAFLSVRFSIVIDTFHITEAELLDVILRLAKKKKLHGTTINEIAGSLTMDSKLQNVSHTLEELQECNLIWKKCILLSNFMKLPE